MTRALPLLILAAALGCQPSLPEKSKIEGLRVLGIRADTPEVGPGDTVALDALVTDKAGRDVSYRWSACLLPERGSGFFSGGDSGSSGGGGYSLDDPGTCAQLARYAPGEVLDLGTGPTATLTVPADLLADSSRIAALYGLDASGPLVDAAVQYLVAIAGVNLTVALVVTAGEDRIETFKRVNVSTAATPNTNPPAPAFHLTAEGSGEEAPETAPVPAQGRCFLGEDGGPVAVGPGQWVLTAVNLPDPPERYPVLVPGNTESLPPQDQCGPGCVMTDETWFWSFFSTQGHFDHSVVKSTGQARVVWTLDDDTTGPVPIWIVARDARGGTAWCRSELPLVTP